VTLCGSSSIGGDVFCDDRCPRQKKSKPLGFPGIGCNDLHSGGAFNYSCWKEQKTPLLLEGLPAEIPAPHRQIEALEQRIKQFATGLKKGFGSLIAKDQGSFRNRVIGKVRAGLPRKRPGRRGGLEVQTALALDHQTCHPRLFGLENGAAKASLRANVDSFLYEERSPTERRMRKVAAIRVGGGRRSFQLALRSSTPKSKDSSTISPGSIVIWMCLIFPFRSLLLMLFAWLDLNTRVYFPAGTSLNS
jgi:hypothetical protein